MYAIERLLQDLPRLRIAAHEGPLRQPAE